MINIDMWYGDDHEKADKIDVTFYPNESNVAHIVLGIDWKYLNLKPIYKRGKYNKKRS